MEEHEKITKLPSSYYRVTTRAIILDERMRVLVIEDDDGRYELPGGGWKEDESFEECVRREVKEELGVNPYHAGLAQLFRARPCQGRGQGLESPDPHHLSFRSAQGAPFSSK
jgi:8-oxo-dGTP pyrophosphatase MutT (NUDIX family)